MAELDFSAERWDAVRATYGQWWAGTLERPIIPVEIKGRDPGRPVPSVPLLSQTTCTLTEFGAAEIIDRIDCELACNHYAGDAFPYFNMDCFGPGAVAAFLGAEIINETGHVWFETPPVSADDIETLHFEYDASNKWLNRVKDIYKAGMDRWQGQILMGMPDLGGICDLLAVFMPGGELQIALYEEPDEVKRLIKELQELWFRYYDELLPLVSPDGKTMTDWSSILNLEPGYIIQSDFSVMVSPDMFDEFILPELRDTCRRLPTSVYHLDGPDEIRHLDSLLTIDELDGVQWIPGAAEPVIDQWPELLDRIAKSGKLLQLINNEIDFPAYGRALQMSRSAKGRLLRQFPVSASERDVVLAWLQEQGVPANAD